MAQAPGSGDASRGGRSVSPRTLWLAAAALVLAVATPGAWLQAPRPDPYAVPAIRDPAWWLSPIEHNAFRRLPVIVANLNSVFVLPGTEHVWAVGDGGMIAYSADGGRTWQQQNRPRDTAPSRSALGGVATAEAQESQKKAEPSNLAAGTIAVPDLGKRSVGEARDILAKSELQIDFEASRLILNNWDIVIRQSPAAGTRVRPGTRVIVGWTPGPRPGAKDDAPIQQPPPKPPPEIPIAQRDLFAVHFADARRGWAVGHRGVILATSDGGQYWAPQPNSLPISLYAVHFLADGQHGWVAGDGGAILVTTNGGQSWRSQATPAKARWRAIVFAADGRRGWSAGADGTILTTSTGGELWSLQPSGTRSNLSALQVDAGSGRGWAAGDGGTILATLDGGNRWSAQSSGTSTALLAIRFAADNRRGWAVGAKGTLLTTTDGGGRWAASDSGTRADLRAIALGSDGLRGWIVGTEGTVLAEADGEPRWLARTGGRRSGLVGLHVDPGGRRVWAVGGDGTLVESTDGGHSWQPRPTGARAGLNAAFFLADGRRGWAAGDDGTLLSTTDGGAHWEPQRLPARPDASPDLLDVGFGSDGQRGWAATSLGILGTTDGGVQWKPEEPARPVAAIHATETHAWIVGRGGMIVTSANGSAWSGQKSGTTADLLGVTFDGRGERGWVVGNNGTILTTGDGGATWIRRTSGTTAALRSVAFLAGGLRGWAVGWDGTILGTDDGGLQWHVQPSHTKVPLSSVRFAADSQRGWISGWGTILMTGDAGQTWAPVAPATTSPAPWYYATWLVALLLLVPALRRPPAQEASQRSVADVLVSDKPLELGEPDPLGFGQAARGLSRFLRNEQTKPPLTIAITGPWGSGKSSLMNLVRGDLRTRGFRPVWFNAWHHQKEEHLLAALLQNILAQAVPGWLTREGVAFRARLLWQRSGRRWYLVLPLLALLAALAGFLAADYPARVDTLLDRSGAVVDGVTDVVVPFFPTALTKSLEAFKHALSGTVLGTGVASRAIPTTVATLVLVFMVWRGITAFGVSPADLMATVSGRFQRRTLEAKVGFRHEFAQEFHDVTRALHPRTMLILIDDLDRCRPENVLEVLEAVNFLVSSGDCFVVMGMELDRVRRCVGLAFKDVAAELTDQEERETTVETPALAAERDEGKRRRAVFAQQYLEKLINIEVPVPVPTEVQAARIIAPDAEPLDELARWRTLGAHVVRVARVLGPVAALFLVVVVGFSVALVIWPPAPTLTPSALTAAPASPSSPPVASTGPVLDPTPPSPDTLAFPAVVVGGDSTRPSRWFLAWPLSVLLLAAVAMFLKRPPIVVKDSDEFRQALKVWHPLVFSRRSTPRSAKRFLNRVRYYAMRQRDLPEERRIDRISAWLAARLGRAPSPVASEPIDTIPERVLVGLSAIEHCHPEWLSDARLFKDPEGFLADQPLPGTFKATVPDLGLGRDLLRYQAPFDKLSAGIRT